MQCYEFGVSESRNPPADAGRSPETIENGSGILQDVCDALSGALIYTGTHYRLYILVIVVLLLLGWI